MTTLLLASDPPSNADWMVAWGTLLTALFALGGLGITIWLWQKDRQRAATDLKAEQGAADARLQAERDQHQKDIDRAEKQLAVERARADQQRATEYQLRTLESVVEQYARWQANKGQPGAVEANGRLQVLLRILPDGAAAYLKHDLGMLAGQLDHAEIRALQEEHRTFELQTPLPPEWVYGQLARDARKIAGLPPA